MSAAKLHTPSLTNLLVIIAAILANVMDSQSCPVKCTCPRSHSVDCSDRGLVSVPANLPSGTRVLNLSGNKIAHLPPNAFGVLQSLTDLSLARNRLTTIPTFTANNSLLEKLRLSENRITAISGSAIAALWRLKTLDLKENYIQDLTGTSFPKTNSLRVLQLNRNKIKAINDTSFKHLTRLRQLKLAQNSISAWKTTLSNPLKNLKILDLSGNLFTELRGLMFTGLLKLRVLYLRKNKIRYVRSGALYFGFQKANYKSTLKELYIECNQLKEIHGGCTFGLESARKMNISHNKIESIGSSTFTGFLNLKELDLSKNRLSFITQGMFSGLESLTSLSLANNNISRIGEKSFYDLVRLSDLDLSHNRICWQMNETKAFFRGARKLATLNLSGNRIQSIHRTCFSGLPHLEILNIANNCISVIQKGALFHLVAFKEIHLNSSYFRCDCNWFLVWIVKKELSGPVSGVCRTGRLNGTNIKDVKLAELTCSYDPVVTPSPKPTNAASPMCNSSHGKGTDTKNGQVGEERDRRSDSRKTRLL